MNAKGAERNEKVFFTSKVRKNDENQSAKLSVFLESGTNIQGFTVISYRPPP